MVEGSFSKKLKVAPGLIKEDSSLVLIGSSWGATPLITNMRKTPERWNSKEKGTELVLSILNCGGTQEQAKGGRNPLGEGLEWDREKISKTPPNKPRIRRENNYWGKEQRRGSLQRREGSPDAVWSHATHSA